MRTYTSEVEEVYTSVAMLMDNLITAAEKQTK
jgi:hypothetical protein